MATTLAQLDTALASLTTAVTQLTTDVQALVSKVQAAGSPDVTNELNAVNASLAQLQSIDTSAQAAVNPPTP